MSREYSTYTTVDENHTEKTYREVEVSPECLRVVAYLVFGILVGTGIALTKLFADVPDVTLIQRVFGYNNICVYFDYPPASYVLATLWVVFLFPWIGYIVAFWCRASIDHMEGRLSKTVFFWMTVSSIFEILSSAYFIQVFASKPREGDTLHLHSLTMHMHPFTIFVVAIFTMSLKNVCYFRSTGRLSKLMMAHFYVFIVLLLPLTVWKVISHLNAMANGPIWVPDDDHAILFGGLMDKLWTFLVAVVAAFATWCVERPVSDTIKISICLCSKNRTRHDIEIQEATDTTSSASSSWSSSSDAETTKTACKCERVISCCCACTIVGTVLFFCLMWPVFSFQVHGSNFNFATYWYPLIKFKGLERDAGYPQSTLNWYQLRSIEDPSEGVGLGENTMMYYGHETCSKMLSEVGTGVQHGNWEKKGELGEFWLNGVPWPEASNRLTLASDREDHAFLRPLFAKILDHAESTAEECDGSQCWNSKWLSSWFNSYLKEVKSFSTSDLLTLNIQLLHKVHVNLDISFEEASEFAAMLKKFLPFAMLPPSLAGSPLIQALMKWPAIRAFKQQRLTKYKAAFQTKFPDKPWASDDELTLLASGVFDSLALAGGISIPKMLKSCLALMYTVSKKWAVVKDIDFRNTTQLQDFVFETIRLFPPVHAFPQWVKDEQGSWKHELIQLQMAMLDDHVFPDPLAFKMHRPGMNSADSSKSLVWADAAVVDGDISHSDSHSCPGKNLSLQVMFAFLREFVALGPWEVDESDIQVIPMGSMHDFTLNKVSG